MKKIKNKSKKNRRLLFWLIALCITMFGFSFALVPLYNVLCDVFNINGKVKNSGNAINNNQTIDASRSITIQFLANVNNQLPWDFYPQIKQITVHPGENKTIYYIAKNNSNQSMTVQAIPSVTPGLAAQYFKKIVCFCFERQTLDAHQSVKMPVVFYVDTALPKNIPEITLSYSLFRN